MSQTRQGYPSDQSPKDEPVDPEKKAKRPWQAWLSGSPVLVISILLHVLFAIIAALLIVQRIQEKRKQNFTEVSVTPASSAAAAANHSTQVTEKKNAMTTPEITHSITVTDLSQITLPQVTLPADSSPSGSGKLEGTALNGVGVSGTGTEGPGTGVSMDMTNIAASVFGMPNGKGLGLAGHFYDLKQTKDGQPTNLDVVQYSSVIAEFMHSGWHDNFFDKYFVGPKMLYLPQVWIPYQSADNGPKAFNLQDLVQPSRWVALYKGKIRSPVTATYRFYGYADDMLEIAIDGRTVFDGSYRDDPNKVINFPNPSSINVAFNAPDGPGAVTIPMQISKWITLEEDKDYEFQILIGERPGGWFGAWLLVEDQGKTYKKTDAGFPILPLFKVGNVKMPDSAEGCPPYDKEASLGWKLSDDNDDSSSN